MFGRCVRRRVAGCRARWRRSRCAADAPRAVCAVAVWRPVGLPPAAFGLQRSHSPQQNVSRETFVRILAGLHISPPWVQSKGSQRRERPASRAAARGASSHAGRLRALLWGACGASAHRLRIDVVARFRSENVSRETFVRIFRRRAALCRERGRVRAGPVRPWGPCRVGRRMVADGYFRATEGRNMKMGEQTHFVLRSGRFWVYNPPIERIVVTKQGSGAGRWRTDPNRPST